MAGRPTEPKRGKPKRVLSSYQYFCDVRRTEMRQQQNGKKITFTELGREWKKLSDEQKEQYQQIVQQKKEEYKTALNEYQNSKVYKKYIEELRIWQDNNPKTKKEKTRTKGVKSKELKSKKKKKGNNNLKKDRVSTRKETESDNQNEDEFKEKQSGKTRDKLTENAHAYFEKFKFCQSSKSLRGKETDSNLSGYLLDETESNSSDQNDDDLPAMIEEGKNDESAECDVLMNKTEQNKHKAKCDDDSMEKAENENGSIKEAQSSGNEADDEL